MLWKQQLLEKGSEAGVYCKLRLLPRMTGLLRKFNLVLCCIQKWLVLQMRGWPVALSSAGVGTHLEVCFGLVSCSWKALDNYHTFKTQIGVLLLCLLSVRKRENHLHLHYAVSLLENCVSAEEGSRERGTHKGVCLWPWDPSPPGVFEYANKVPRAEPEKRGNSLCSGFCPNIPLLGGLPQLLILKYPPYLALPFFLTWNSPR